MKNTTFKVLTKVFLFDEDDSPSLEELGFTCCKKPDPEFREVIEYTHSGGVFEMHPNGKLYGPITDPEAYSDSGEQKSFRLVCANCKEEYNIDQFIRKLFKENTP